MCNEAESIYLQGYEDSVSAKPVLLQENTMKYKGISIIKRTDANTWYARYRYNGNQYRVSGKTQQETYNKLKQALRFRDQPNKITYTLKQWMENWQTVYKSENRESTKKIYEYTKNKYFKGILFDTYIDRIQTIDIQQFLNKIKLPKPKLDCYIYLNDALDKAKREGIIPRNPLDPIKKPKLETKEKTVLTREQELELIKLASQHKYGNMILVQLYQGLRPGECIALEWEDFDFDKLTININKSISSLSNDKGLKNKASYRTIPMFENTRQLLEPIKSKGRLWTLSRRRQQEIALDIFKKANIQNFTLHQLRHTFITKCQDQNIPEHIIQSWVGHTIGSSITKSVYTHKTTDTEQKFIDYFNNNQ